MFLRLGHGNGRAVRFPVKLLLEFTTNDQGHSTIFSPFPLMHTTQAVSKRVINARSAAHYKRNGPVKRRTEDETSFWSTLSGNISTHPLLFAFVAFMMLFSGIATFWMNDRHSRAMFG